MKLFIALGLSILAVIVLFKLVVLIPQNEANKKLDSNPPVTAASFGIIPLYFGVKYLLNKDKKDKEKKS